MLKRIPEVNNKWPKVEHFQLLSLIKNHYSFILHKLSFYWPNFMFQNFLNDIISKCGQNKCYNEIPLGHKAFVSQCTTLPYAIFMKCTTMSWKKKWDLLIFKLVIILLPYILKSLSKLANWGSESWYSEFHSSYARPASPQHSFSLFPQCASPLPL